MAEDGPTRPTRPGLERLEPEPIVVKNDTGVSFVCFTPTEGQEVARIFTDYHTIWFYMISLEAEILTFNREIVLLTDNANRWESLYIEADERGNTYKISFESIHNQLMESEKARYEKNRWAWVPWSITALVAVAASVAVIAK